MFDKQCTKHTKNSIFSIICKECLFYAPFYTRHKDELMKECAMMSWVMRTTCGKFGEGRRRMARKNAAAKNKTFNCPIKTKNCSNNKDQKVKRHTHRQRGLSHAAPRAVRSTHIDARVCFFDLTFTRVFETSQAVVLKAFCNIYIY